MKPWIKSGLITALVGLILVLISSRSDISYELHNSSTYSVFNLIFWRVVFGLVIFFILGAVGGHLFRSKKQKLVRAFKLSIIPLILALLTLSMDSPGSAAPIIIFAFLIVVAFVLALVGWFKK